MWECRIGIEGVRSVPLEERMVISMGEKELHVVSISILCDCHSLGIAGSVLILVEARLDSLLWDVPYLELSIESLFMQIPSVNRTDSKVPGVVSLIANILDMQASKPNLEI